MRHEAGVTNIQYPYDPRWTGVVVDAASVEDAETLFENQGFYRNLMIREIAPSQRLISVDDAIAACSSNPPRGAYKQSDEIERNFKEMRDSSI